MAKTREIELPNDIFDLDPLTLDKHFLEQPKLVWEYGQELANAKDGADRSKAVLDVAKAEALAEISANPNEFSLNEKPTVSAINSAVDVHETVVAARDKFQRRKHRVDVLQAFMVALEHRKRSLEGLVTLHGQQYFAMPKADEQGQAFLSDQTREGARGKKKARKK